jgi:site-specific recombinase XerD
MVGASEIATGVVAGSAVILAPASSLATAGFAKMVERAGTAAGFDFKAHPHMLRHACGFALANAGHDTRALQAYLAIMREWGVGVPGDRP